jgi:hypothetical protein
VIAYFLGGNDRMDFRTRVHAILHAVAVTADQPQ